ncbi:unnamed protein product [Polarella glacialis]|uniref:Sugar phosphate transporter domain-containing protein n=1 Tax=Polarella glacialis TaxID=89957 RepID=A0A813GMA2_POLGL|nr:unnamed protein product [Polarella glacialis]
MELLEKTGLRRMLSMIVASSLFMLVGPMLIVVNKRIMTEVGFPYPMLLSALGVSGSAAVTHLAVALGLAQVRQECLEFASGSNWYYRILPVGFCSAATMTFGNFQYLYMDLGFIQMLKAFTPVVVLISLAAFGLERPSMPVLGSVVLIALGTMVTAAAAPEWSIGLFFTFGAEVSEALRLTLTQLILSSRKFSVVEGQYILAPVVSACLLIGGSFTELPHAWESGALRAPLEYPLLFLWAAVLGIGVNYLSYLVIQTAGALTLKVLATLRNIGLIGYGIAVLGEQVSSEQAMGYSVALVGFVGYTYFTGTRGRLSSPTASTAPTQGVKIQ